MKEPHAYKGREQTYLKHSFLDWYLERVAYNIGWKGDFVYVDGFSGPWRSKDDAFEDTSFMIAVRKLRRVRASLAEHGKFPAIRCVFVEKDPKAFAELEQATEDEDVDDIAIRVINSEFEAALPEIQAYVGGSFHLTFIDPTGWTGFALQTIAPLLEMGGEVLINFMFEHINRFLTDPRDATAETFDRLFGSPEWEDAVGGGEEAILDLYQEQLKSVCNFDYATRTRVMMPLRERTHFHLVYATRHPKGLEEFRAVEKKFMKEQGIVRADAKQAQRIEGSRQAELFRDADGEPASSLSFEEEQRRNLQRGRALILEALGKQSPLPFEAALPPLLELPMVDKSAARNIMKGLRDEGCLRVEGMQKGQRLPGPGCRLVKPQ